MNKELQQAMVSKDSKHSFREHIHAIRLMCDLLLDDESDSKMESVSQTASEELELRKMMGDLSSSLAKPTVDKPRSNDKIDHDDANGSSIFEF